MIVKRFIAIAVVACFLMVTSVPVSAHSGGTDRHGCHAGTEPYHCHNSKDDDKAGEIALIILGAVVVLWLVGRLLQKPMPQADISDVQDGDGKLSWEWRF